MKNLTIGRKLSISFGLITLLMMIMGGISIVQINQIAETYDELVSNYQKIGYKAKDVEIEILTARRHEKDFIVRRDKQYVERMDQTMGTIDILLTGISEKGQRLGLDTVQKDIQAALAASEAYHAAFREVTTLILAQGDKDTGILGNLWKLADGLETEIKQTGSSDLIAQYLRLRGHEKDYVLKEDDTYLKRARGVVKKIETMLKFGDPDTASKVNKQARDYVNTLGAYSANVASMQAQYPVMQQAAQSIEKAVSNINNIVEKVVAARVDDAQKSKTRTVWMLYLACAVIMIIGIILAFFAVRSVTGPVTKAVEGLTLGSDQVASAAGQVSSASQSLAEGASEQAASIEETSSSLEEMSSMTRQNAENANQADTLMKDANKIVVEANQSMNELTISMADISNASDETSKIIKTIDEIAFQTNLLALNAAVEAARAGEAGAGFAVVADEVRNLAMRAADAAKNTSTLIEDTVGKIAAGSDLVSTTNTAFDKVAESSEKVAALVSEISSASNEQSQGISQINSAVTEMDKVVQKNAASAEESASASEEMSAQAEQMKSMVNGLLSLVKSGVEIDPCQAPQSKNKTRIPEPYAHSKVARSADASKPEDIIPLDDDFEDF